MYDFCKLLNVLAPIKVGIFHLPSYPTTSRVWVQDENTGNLEWESKVIDATKLDEYIILRHHSWHFNIFRAS